MQRTQAGKLVPAEPGLLAEAARWVDRWQEPTGHTNYDAALQMAERYMEADCQYIFSDGLSDYAVGLLEVSLNAFFAMMHLTNCKFPCDLLVFFSKCRLCVAYFH